MKERVLITVKTYPTISQKYGELVCTAGIREDGSWVRLYPIPFRKLDKAEEQYKKYQWLSAEIKRRSSDPRPESFSPDIDSIELGAVIPPSNQWAERCRLVLEKGTVYDDMTQLIELANANTLSLATYKPSEVLDLTAEKVAGEWAADKLKAAKALHSQGDLFAEDDQLGKIFNVVDKLPYKFKYRFKDKDGQARNLMIEDWEIGALYWNCLRDAEGDETVAVQKVKEKYLNDFSNKRDLYLFVGTTQRYHGWTPNPFVIIGTFTPPKNRHPELGLWG
jgi:hypothetical protein